MLLSEDHGKTWQWSRPIEAVHWSEMGEDPEKMGEPKIGRETVVIWEPSVFECPDGRLGLLIRNSTAQGRPHLAEKPWRMLLFASSTDHGRTWTPARPVELNTVCSRNFSVVGPVPSNGLLMVMNDNDVRIPRPIAADRYYLALYCAPVCNPDLLLPGPLVQPAGGLAYYPNGFIDGDRLRLVYTYAGRIYTSVVAPLPRFDRPFLLPRGGRPGLRIEGGTAFFEQRQSSLGLVLTAEETRAAWLRLAFRIDIRQFDGRPVPILTIGGVSRAGRLIHARYSPEIDADVFQVRDENGHWKTLADFRMKQWIQFELKLSRDALAIRIDGSPPVRIPGRLLRKLCFGGLYARPAWPVGVSPAYDIRLDLGSLVIETGDE
jgi:hypothetical protein